MPEHKTLLYEYYKETHKIPMPQMDDQIMFVYEEVINEALFNGDQIKVTYYDTISGNMKSCKGHVRQIDYFERCVRLIGSQTSTESIPFTKILAVELLSTL